MAGASDIIFGLFWLLGYQFSPRLVDAGEAVFWRVDKSADYGPLDDLARSCTDLSKAEEQWDEMMRTAGSLKLGAIHASELVRSLLKSSRPSGLAQAIMEVGRVNNTLYLLNYIDDEDYHRRIPTQLNRGEGRHAVARAVCMGNYPHPTRGNQKTLPRGARRSVRGIRFGYERYSTLEHALHAGSFKLDAN